MKTTTQTTLLIAFGLYLLCGPSAAQDAAAGDECYDVPEYTGINAVPAVTMQIHPAAAGDTVVNDAEYPPGMGPKVVVGFWEHPEATISGA
ncbi:MAG: hypothetical protein GY856_37865 [bacterium]|nr:hypothetical protein [bacterium]